MLPTTLDSDEVETKLSNEIDHNSFWQYNKLSKGPKPSVTYKVNVSHAKKNPHMPILFNDPIYDTSQPQLVQHYGRARMGEGNDITPDPQKLAKLGADLEKVKKKMASLGDEKKDRKEKMRCSSQ